MDDGIDIILTVFIWMGYLPVIFTVISITFGEKKYLLGNVTNLRSNCLKAKNRIQC